MVTKPDTILELRFPASVYDALVEAGMDLSEIAREARESLAARLYNEEYLSIGKAAELAGMPIVEFMELLRSMYLPVVRYDDAEYAQDLGTIAALEKERGQP